MKFTRLDTGVYRAIGVVHLYRIMRDGKAWRLDVHEQRLVVPSCTIAGDRVDVSFDDTLTLCKAVAEAYEIATNEYRLETGQHYMNRLTVAVQRAYYGEAS